LSQRLPLVISRGRLRLPVRLTPKSAADRILGLAEDGPQGPALRVAVTAAPVDGKANAALIRLLAREFEMAPRDLSIVGGASSRQKLVEFAGDPSTLAPRIERRLSACPTPS
jgi:uncharacterized protein (TIGR00251 family)